MNDRSPAKASGGSAASDDFGDVGAAGRRIALRRASRETEVLLFLDLDGASSGRDRDESVRIDTGIGFLDHLVSSLAFHALWSLDLTCRGDLEVDDHHSVEDSALLLGEAIARALALGPAPARFGWAYAPLDEALARAVVDLSGRAHAMVNLGLGAGRLGDLAAENVTHFLLSLASAARMTLHVDVERGENGHHRAEAAFKALALALRAACAPGAGTSAGEGSTKGSVLIETVEPSLYTAARAELAARRGRAVSAGNRAAGDRAAAKGAKL